VLPLYSMLSGKEQMRVFQRARRGVRLIVVATNVTLFSRDIAILLPNN
jgi:HrpA-like RNA helicase